MHDSKILRLVIPEAAIGKGRPRTTRTGHVYTDAKTRAWEQLVARKWRAVVGERIPDDCTAFVKLMFNQPIPQSWPKYKKLAALNGKIEPASSSDLDNQIKSILDGLNGEAWADDVQVTHIEAHKKYAVMPSVEVEVSVHGRTPNSIKAAQTD